MEPLDKPTIRDVAKALGLAMSTISMSLRDHPRISLKTRQRVQKKAKEMGYRPDPRVANVMSYLKKRRTDKPVASLAYVATSSQFAQLEGHPIYQNYYLGAKERALELGYRVDNFNLQPESMSGKRLVSILRNRGIEGILIPPAFVIGTKLDFDWSGLSAITFGYSIDEAGINRVTIDQYLMVLRSLEAMARLGYKRIGFVSGGLSNFRMQYRWEGALLAFQSTHENQTPIPHFEGDDRKEFLRWFRRTKPDAILGAGLKWAKFLHDEGLHCPKDYGYATLEHEAQRVQSAAIDDPDWATEFKEVAGMNQESFHMGSLAAELVAQDLALNIKGHAARPKTTTIAGRWVDGPTLKFLK